MASHSELRPDDASLPLLIASAALSKAESRLTVATGTVVADNADGTQTWIGSNGSDDTSGVIKWVGDLSAPGRPLGLSAACSMQCVVVSWDGTLENGVPSDFAYIEVFARREGSVDDVVSWGRLSSAGMLMSPRYDIGTVFDVYAIAYDDAHDSTGMLARNQSEQSDLITVAVEQDADMEQIDAAVEEMSKKADEASAKAEQVRKDMQSEVDSVKSDVSKVESEAAQLKADAAKLSQTVDANKTALDKSVAAADAKAQAASDKGDQLGAKITEVTSTVNGQASKLQELSTRIEGVASDNTATVQSVTELKQTVTGLDARVTQNTATANGAMSKATSVEVTANGIKTDLSENYTATAKADEKYSTKTELTATADGLKSSISSVKSTAEGAVSKANEAKSTADGISVNLSKNYTPTSEADAKYATQTSLKATADGLTAKITANATKAQSALDKSTSLEANLNGFKTTVSETYTTKTDFNNLAIGGTNRIVLTGGSAGRIDGSGDTYTFDTDSHWTSAFVAADPSTTYLLHSDIAVAANTYVSVAFYDADKKFVSRPTGALTNLTAPWTKTVSTPTNAAFLRVFFPNDQKGHIKLEKGSKPTDWSPAPEDLQTAGDYATNSSLQQTASSITARVASVETTANGAMSKATTVQQTADGIKTTLSKDYTSTKDADKKYSTKTELTTEAGRIRADLTETTKTANGAMDKSTTLETTVNGISTKISEQATTLNATVKTANEAKSTADSNKQTISQVSQTASGALTKATTVEANLNSYKTTVSETYTAKTDTEALKKSTALCYTFKGAKGSPTWYKLGHLVSAGDASNICLSVLTGNGYNGESAQNSQFEIYIKDGYQSTPSATKAFGVNVSRVRNANNVKVKVMASSGTECDVWVYLPWSYWNGDYTLIGEYASWTDGAKTTGYISSSEPTSGTAQTGLAYDTFSTQSYVNQTSKSVALGVVQDYKGADGSGLATKSDISVSKTEITSEVSNTYATKDGVSKEISSKITQNNSSLEVKFSNAGSIEYVTNGSFRENLDGWTVDDGRWVINGGDNALQYYKAVSAGASTLGPRQDPSVLMGTSTRQRLIRRSFDIANYSNASGATLRMSCRLNDGTWSGEYPSVELDSTFDWMHVDMVETIPAGKYIDRVMPVIRATNACTINVEVRNFSLRDITDSYKSADAVINMTGQGVRVGKNKNGAWTGMSALVGTDATFDVLDTSSKRLLEVSATGVKFPHSKDGTRLALGYVAGTGSASDTLYIGGIITGQQEGGPKNRLGFTGDEVSLEGGDIGINANDNQLSLYGHKGANLLVPDGGNVQVGGQSGTSNTTLTLRGSTVNLYGGLINVNGRALNAPVDAKQSQRWNSIQLDVKCVNRVVTVNVLHPLGSNAVIGDQSDQCEIGYIKEGYRPSRMIGCHLAAYNTTNLFLEINPSTGKVTCFRLWGNQNTWAYFSASLSYVI